MFLFAPSTLPTRYHERREEKIRGGERIGEEGRTEKIRGEEKI
jgi:hypothetical protein